MRDSDLVIMVLRACHERTLTRAEIVAEVRTGRRSLAVRRIDLALQRLRAERHLVATPGAAGQSLYSVTPAGLLRLHVHRVLDRR